MLEVVSPDVALLGGDEDPHPPGKMLPVLKASDFFRN
eukprot:CAMPEP_0114675076 /NCGR_PEP_ID=MMETSP0191-20121206/47355_1 /TAXON_ID=126664 /ORGANISM="Sorites sp." /LENGTH=36 /DNA_ID= /DNA_START= /DNA_END= /DNA_ORIENTATION=